MEYTNSKQTNRSIMPFLSEYVLSKEIVIAKGGQAQL